jgi:hypothetical protein
LRFEQIKAGGNYIADALNGSDDAVVVVQGNKGTYLIDMATVGNGKQGFFVLDPSSTITTLEPWSFSELQHKLGVSQVYVVKRAFEIKKLPYKNGEKPQIKKLPYERPKSPGSQFPKQLTDGTLYLSQWDNRWANKAYPKPNGDFKTISQSGCEPTTAAWVLRTLGVDPTTTPVDQARANMHNGGRSSSLEAVREMAKKYNLKFSNISGFPTSDRIEAIQHALSINPETGKSYGVVMASGQDASRSDPAPFTSSGHVLGIYKIDDKGRTKVMDPNSLLKSEKWWTKKQLVGRASYIYIIYR